MSSYKNSPGLPPAFFPSIDINNGNVPGYSWVQKFGENPNIGTGSIPEDVWHGGGLYSGFPTGSAELVTVVSSSVDDTSGGAGARTVRISGLDASYLEQSEVITLNGTSTVDSVNTYTRVFRIVVLTSGLSNTALNAGDISVAHKVTTANIFAVAPAGKNQSRVLAYTIPAGKKGFLTSSRIEMSKGGSATANGDFWIREFGRSPVLKRPFIISQNSSLRDSPEGGLLLPEKTDITVRINNVSGNNTVVFGNFDILLVPA